MPTGFMALVTVVMHMVSAHDRGSTILRQGGTQNVQSEIVTNRTRAFLSCESGDMVIKVNFTLPFRGLLYAHKTRTSPCRVHGAGAMYYVLRIPLKGCGTWQESPRVFVNNITIRFHPALELEEDETKTVVCRYPPPLTPPPGSIHIVEPITPPTSDPTKVLRARLSEVEILIIICLLLFLSLLTLGIGIAYFCLKRRNIQLVRRKPQSSAPASQLTKLSGSTPQQPSLVTGAILGHTVRIPRAVPYSASSRTHTISDHQNDYEENSPGSPVISRDSLDSTVTTSTTSGDSADVIDQLLLTSLKGPSSILTIPKAVLRKGDQKRQTLPSLHKQFIPLVSPLSRSAGELEDQTVTTVLEPEYNDYGNNYGSRFQPAASGTDAIPVYAQVDKRKHRVRIMEQAQIIHSDDDIDYGTSKPKYKESDFTFGKMGNIFATTSPTKKGSSEKNSDSRNIASKIAGTLHIKKFFRNSDGVKTSPHAKEAPDLKRNNETIHLNDRLGDKYKIYGRKSDSHDVSKEQLQKTDSDSNLDGRKVCIKDISDIYVTTTIETESTEIRTTVSRDIIEEHAKDSKATPDGGSHSDNSKIAKKDQRTSPVLQLPTQIETSHHSVEKDPIDVKVLDEKRNKHVTDHSVSSDETNKSLSASGESSTLNQTITTVDLKTSTPTNNWNVIIRQRKPTTTEIPEFAEETVDGKEQISKPRFDVKIRTIPPAGTTVPEKGTFMDRRDSTELVDVPQLKMLHSIEKIRGVIAQLEPKHQRYSAEDPSTSGIKTDLKPANLTSASTQPKGVWWPKNPDPIIAIYSPEPTDDMSGLDSYRSDSSLRERSSSEVLEKAPTLSTHTRKPDNPGLERSTSEIVTARGDHSKWIKDVPVFETYSPEFLSTIPVVAQGGFFHGPSHEEKPEKKEHATSES